MIRGGFWDNIAGYCRSAARDIDDPDYRHDGVGFRVLLAPGQP